jgi:hypothetical protein
MKGLKSARFWLFCALVAALLTAGIAAAEQTVPPEVGTQSMEMPVLTGTEWQGLSRDAKLAFIWGVGHVVTIEEHVVQRHPELAKPDFPTKLAEGLRGMPMNAIVDRVDAYYKTNPGALTQPVMRVIWRQLVKPKLKSGIANRPLEKEPDGER